MQEEQCSATTNNGNAVPSNAAIVNLKCTPEDFVTHLQIKSDPNYSDGDESDLEVA